MSSSDSDSFGSDRGQIQILTEELEIRNPTEEELSFWYPSGPKVAAVQHALRSVELQIAHRKAVVEEAQETIARNVPKSKCCRTGRR
jgi:hypothetical protein